MPAEEIKKRRACDSCTKAKAKCLPLGSGAMICQRCSRLNKECVYGDSLRKRGPKTRSRMKQLEQRVESLVDLLVVGGQSTERRPELLSSSRTDSRVRKEHTAVVSPPYMTPKESPRLPSTDKPLEFDPVEAGLLRESKAAELLDEFRREHAYVFPFVVVDAHIDSGQLRRQQPFLFLSIMAAMSYRMPRTQRLLGDAFKDEVAVRIVGRSHKGLEMLQGLLVHTAYYHFFYRPGKQQLALMVQLCVAMAQDFGVSKKWRAQHSSCHSFDKSLAGQRAMLGTYYLAAGFAHAWRKRSTMHYTRALSRSCQTFSQNPEHPSDILIAPLIHASELICRINDHFSYDEIGDSDIVGETMIDLSVKNFSAELQRLRDTTPEAARANISTCVTFDMIEVLIYECSFHETLWNPSTDSKMVSPARSQMLQRCVKAAHKLASTVLKAPSSSFHHLAFPAWSNWFYSTLLVVKIIIFQRTGSTGSTCVHNAPHAVGELLPQEYGEMATQAVCTMTNSLSKASIHDQTVTSDELWLINTFEAFLHKLAAATPHSEETNCESPAKPFLDKVATLQKGLLAGLKKITAPRADVPTPEGGLPGPAYQPPASGHNTAETTANTLSNNQSPYGTYNGVDPASVDQTAIFGDPSDFLYFDNSALSDFPSTGSTPGDDWLWNMVMNDGSNIFTL